MATFARPPLSAIDAALLLLPSVMDTPAARAMLLAIGWQESGFAHRHQINGPARGYWQFEQGGGVAGVLRHPTSREYARTVCRARDTPATVEHVYGALDQDDVLAAALARLLLWTDPAPIPPADHSARLLAWEYYLRNWRPGKPHPQRWPDCHAIAVETLSIAGD